MTQPTVYRYKNHRQRNRERTKTTERSKTSCRYIQGGWQNRDPTFCCSHFQNARTNFHDFRHTSTLYHFTDPTDHLTS